MTLSIVVAASENNVIGKDNRLLWTLPNDMKFFKNTTWGMPVIMGRKTFESLGKPLAGRTNIIVSSRDHWHPEGAIVVNTLEAAVEAARSTDALEAYIIGGGEIYRQSLPLCSRVYLTRVHTSIEGDTRFPVLSPTDWTLHSRLDFPADAKHAFAYSFEVWDKRPS